MNKITSESIQKLLEKDREADVISIYIPTHRHPTPPFMHEDQTRLKNSLATAQSLWRERGGSDRDIADAISELEGLQDNSEFWKHTTEALAVFIHQGSYEIFHLPIECEERVVVGEDYDVTPLLVANSLNQPYYVLAVGMRDSRLLKGDIYDLEELDIELPKDAHEALNIDEMHSNTMVRKSTQRGSASSAHGEGSSVELGHEERSRYFKMIEQAIIDSDGFDHDLPILLAGTDNEVGDFRAATSLKGVLPDIYMGGSHTETSTRDIYEKSRPLIHSTCIKPRWKEATERFNQMLGTGKASYDIDDIAKAASEGRVDSLIIATLDITADSISDAVTEPAPMLRKPDDNILETVAVAARDSARNGAAVLGVVRDEYLPEGGQLGALYRY